MAHNQPSIRSMAVGTSIVVLVAAGFGHRVLAHRIDALLNDYLRPKKAMSSFPLAVGSWKGQDIAIDEQTRKVAAEDDFLNRRYVQDGTGKVISLYVGYIGRPRSLLGHRPDICYRVHGFEEKAREVTEVKDAAAQSVPVLIFHYSPPNLGGAPQIVLATFVINGKWVNDIAAANDYNARGPALFSAQVAYVARLQLAMEVSGDGSAEKALLSEFASKAISELRDLLPE